MNDIISSVCAAAVTDVRRSPAMCFRARLASWRAAAGDLGRISGWLPPSGARELLPKANVRKRRTPILMAAPLSAAGVRVIKKLTERGAGDCCWPTDHQRSRCAWGSEQPDPN